MWLKGRIIFTILSAMCVVCVIPFGVWLDRPWAGVAAVSAFLFYLLMMLCKNKQSQSEDTTKTQTTDATNSTEEPNEK